MHVNQAMEGTNSQICKQEWTMKMNLTFAKLPIVFMLLLIYMYLMWPTYAEITTRKHQVHSELS